MCVSNMVTILFSGKDIYYWLHTFENLFVTTTSGTRDDLLFYVKYDSKNVSPGIG